MTDPKGGSKSGQIVELSLPAELQGLLVISNGSSVQTDSEGKANFKLVANKNLTAAQIQQLVDTSKTLNFKLIDEHRAEKQATTSLTFKDIATIVDKLEIIKPDAPIAAKWRSTYSCICQNSNKQDLAGKSSPGDQSIWSWCDLG